MADKTKPGRLRKVFTFFCLLICALVALVFVVIEQVNNVTLPEDLKAAPRVALPPPRASTSRAPGLPPVTATGEFEDFQSYLTVCLAREPGLAAAALYLQIAECFNKEPQLRGDFEELFSKAPIDASLDLPASGPVRLTPEQAGWLRRHGALLGLIHRLAQAGPLPMPSTQERLAYMKRTGKPLPVLEYLNLRLCAKICIAESMLRLQQGERPGVRQGIEDSIALAGLGCDGDQLINKFLQVQLIVPTLQLTRLMLDDPATPPAELDWLCATLAQAEERLDPPDMLTRAMAAEYLEMRQEIVNSIEKKSWRSPIFGWDVEQNRRLYEAQLRVPGSRRYVTLPNLVKLVPKAFIAIHLRNNSPEALREFDRYNTMGQKSLDQPFSQFTKIHQEAEEQYWSHTYEARNFLVRICTPNLLEIKRRISENETRLHLVRLGLALRAATSQTLALRREDLAAQPHNPWRDPFTERPLQLDASTSPTLLYSLGPDLHDQGGALSYDPTNGTLSAGDIIMRCR